VATQTTVRVDLGERSYEIAIASQWLDQAGQWIPKAGKFSHAVVITDENVETPHATTVAESLAENDIAVDLVVVAAGEETKCVGVADQLWQQLVELGTDRTSMVIAVGGGVVGDLAGFIAATYARGLRFVQVPTTLLAQVDSSVGGKVAINLPQAKNMVGAFWQPTAVMIDTHTMSTLARREYCAGLGEVIKYGVIQDAQFFAYLEEHSEAINARDNDCLREVVAQCCRLKAEVVQADEREQSGRRAILNYGHTFGHALETVSGYGRLLHGEAVAIGMMCAARLAQQLGMVDDSLAERQQALLRTFDLPVAVPAVDLDAVLDAMQHDKKVAHGTLRFILPTRLGAVRLVPDIDPKLVREALEAQQ